MQEILCNKIVTLQQFTQKYHCLKTIRDYQTISGEHFIVHHNFANGPPRMGITRDPGVHDPLELAENE